MTANPLEVQEGLQYQTTTEEIARSITTTNWGSTPTNVVVAAYDTETETDVTSTVFPTNTPSINGDIITLSKLKALTKGKTYRVEVKFTTGGNICECVHFVNCWV